jgi:1,4-dihydroxy-2-naphthoate octaprenyltransferase
MPHPVWVRELRAPFLLLPAIFVPVGLAIAWSQGHFNPLYAVLTIAGVVCLHASVNVLNDYFDFRSGIDLATTPTPFSGGSTILPSKLMSPSSVLGMGVSFLGVGVLIGTYFIYLFSFDPLLIAIVAVAALSVVSYSSVTSKVGIGELITGLNFGPLLVLGAYYVQTRTVALEPIIIGLPLGILTAGILYVNEFPDTDADKSKGRNQLVARWGKATAAARFKVLMAAAYLVPVVAVLAGAISPAALSILVTLPRARTTVKLVSQNYDKVMELIPGMASMVMTTLFSGVALLAGYLLLGLVLRFFL